MSTIARIILSLAAFIFSPAVKGQSAIKLTQLDKTDLPAAISKEKHEGKIKNAVQWTDQNGLNMAITSETGVYQTEREEGGRAELYAYHYIMKDDVTELTWKVTDFIKDCPVDIEARFIKNTFAVTDLNKDGITEVWLMYVTVCHGDVSPLDMKIIMYEGTQKFAMRGRNKIKFSPTEYMGGDYKFDEAFNTGPASFSDYAKKMWKKHIMGK